MTRDATTWSPARSWLIKDAKTAAMPVAVAWQASGALDQRKTVLEHGDGGVTEAAVDVAGLLIRRARIALFGGLVDEARGQVERLVGFAMLRALGAAPHQLGGLSPMSALVPDAPYAKNPGRAGRGPSLRPFSALV